MKTILSCLVLTALLGACTESADEQPIDENNQTEHAWKTQTDALEDAEDVERLLLDTKNERTKQLGEDEP